MPCCDTTKHDNAARHYGASRNPDTRDWIAVYAAMNTSVHPEMAIFTDLGVGLKL